MRKRGSAEISRKRMLYTIIGLIVGLCTGMVISHIVVGKFLSPILFPSGIAGALLALAIEKRGWPLDKR
jgi:hypothetical protein